MLAKTSGSTAKEILEMVSIEIFVKPTFAEDMMTGKVTHHTGKLHSLYSCLLGDAIQMNAAGDFMKNIGYSAPINYIKTSGFEVLNVREFRQA